jgi:hypothetical protein
MVPIWRSFPGLADFRVSSATSPEKNLNYPLHTAFTFDSEQALQAALASPERQQALDQTKILLKMFAGSVFHIETRSLMHAGQYVGAAGTERKK